MRTIFVVVSAPILNFFLTSARLRNQCALKHSTRKRPLNASINSSSVGFPGRLGLEDIEQVAAYGETAQDVIAPEGRDARARKRRGNRGALPAHLPRIEVVVNNEDKTCPCCRGELHRIG